MKIIQKQKLKFADYIFNWLKEKELFYEEEDTVIDEEQLEETCIAGYTICEALVEAGIAEEIGG